MQTVHKHCKSTIMEKNLKSKKKQEYVFLHTFLPLISIRVAVKNQRTDTDRILLSNR